MVSSSSAERAAQPKRSPLARAAMCAFAIEAALLAAGYAWLAHRAVPKPVPPPVHLTLAPVAAPPKPAPVPSPPKPQPVPAQPAPVKQRVIPKPAPKPAPKPVPKSAPKPLPPTPAPVLPPTPAVPPVATQSAPKPDTPATPAPPKVASPPAHGDPTFESALRSAIQNALRYPESARLAQLSGRARVAFDYRDGLVSNVRLVISSGSGLLDRAALAAVRDAACPKPPARLAGQTLAEQLWVTFNLDDQE